MAGPAKDIMIPKTREAWRFIVVLSLLTDKTILNHKGHQGHKEIKEQCVGRRPRQ